MKRGDGLFPRRASAECQLEVDSTYPRLPRSGIEIIGDKAIYPNATPLNRYITSRIAVLAGTDKPLPDVYVLDDDEINAYTDGEAIYINRGLLDFFDYQEEVDSVLAHELEHFWLGHTDLRMSVTVKEGEVAGLGSRRINELEADLRGFNLLDERGIDPRGMISAFAKLDEHQKANNIELPIWAKHSPVHGATQDRRVNLTQALWFRDVRSLGDGPLTPLMITADEYGTPFDAKLGLGLFEQLRPLEQQACIMDRAKKAPRSLHETLVQQQACVISALHPDLGSEKTNLLAAQLVATWTHSETTDFSPVELLTSLQELGGSGLANIAQKEIVENIERSFDKQVEGLIESGCLRQTVESLRELTGDINIATPALINYIARNPCEAPKALTEVASVLASSNVPLDTVILQILLSDAPKVDTIELGRYAQMTDKKSANEMLRKISIVESTIRENRLEIAQGLYDEPMQLLEYLSRYTSSVNLSMHADSYSFMDNKNEDGKDTDGDLPHFFEFELWDRRSPVIQETLAELAYYLEFGSYKGFFEENAAMRRMSEAAADYLDDIEPETSFETAIGNFRRGALRMEVCHIVSSLSPVDLRNQLQSAGLSRQATLECLNIANNLSEDCADFAKLGFSLLAGDIKMANARFSRIFEAKHEQLIMSRSQFRTEDIAKIFGEQNSQLRWVTSLLGTLEEYIDSLKLDENDVTGAPIGINELLESSVYARTALLGAVLFRVQNNSVDDYKETYESRLKYQPLIDYVLKYPATRLLGEGVFEDGALFGDAQRVADKALEKMSDLADKKRSEGKTFEELPENMLRAILALGLISDNIEMTLQVPAACVRALTMRLRFDDAITFIFEDLKHLPSYALGSAIEYLIEEKASSISEIQRITELMKTRVEALIEENYAEIGMGSVIDTQIIEGYKNMRERTRESALRTDTITGAEPTRLLAAVLKTSQEPDELESYIFDRWWTARRTDPATQDMFTTEDYLVYRGRGKEIKLNWWLNQDASTSYTPLSSIMSNIYLANSLARHIALRKMLLGENGTLADLEGRQQLVAALQETWFKIEDSPDVEKTISGMLQSLIRVNTAEGLYQYLSPVLQELILRPPTVVSDSHSIAEAKAIEMLEPLVKRGRLDYITDRDIENMTSRITLLAQGSKAIHMDEERNTAARQTLLEYSNGHESGADKPKEMSPIQMAILMGKKAGAIGTRMLQLGGQYYSIPEEDKPAFNEIYDQVKGQSRIQAHMLLEREAQHVPEIKQLMDDMRHFGKRIGGGSLVTVYEIKTKGGKKEVLGIRNPNAAYHVAEIADMIDRTLEDATNNDPTNVDLLLSRSLVYDAVDWINRELNDVEFNAKDAIFRSENDTRIAAAESGSQFKKGRSKYDIWVPETTPTNSLWIRREELVEGHNLNGLEIAEVTDITAGKITKDNHRDIVSTLVRNYTHQIMNGSYVHSDVHPGNFRIKSDNTQIAVLDRYNLIPMTEQLRTHVIRLFTSLVSGDISAALDVFVQASDSGTALSAETRTKLLASFSTDNITHSAATVMVQLKKFGVHIPLEISLMMRNIFALVGMAEEAGFGSIVEAFMHTADNEELSLLFQKLQS